MYVKKKIRKRLIIGFLIIFSIIFYRGLKATTTETHDCEFKLIYALCTPKNNKSKLPGILEILKTGIKFNVSPPWKTGK